VLLDAGDEVKEVGPLFELVDVVVGTVGVPMHPLNPITSIPMTAISRNEDLTMAKTPVCDNPV